MSAAERTKRIKEIVSFVRTIPTEIQIKARSAQEIKWIMNQKGKSGSPVKNSTIRAHLTQYRNEIKEIIPFPIRNLEKELENKKRDMISVLNSLDLDGEEYQLQKAEIDRFPIIVEIQSQLDGYAKKNREYGTIRIILDYLKTPQDIQDAIQAQQGEKVNKKLENQKPLDVEKYIKKCMDLLSSKDWLEVIIGIIGLTGRRPQEIIEKGKITTFKKEKQPTAHWSVLFSGQQKTRNDELRDNGYRIPVLADPKLLLEKMTFAREDPRITNPLRREELVRQHFYGILPRPIETKTLRSAYAAICSRLYKHKTIDRDIYINIILGHAKGDTRASQHYKIFQE